jgi:hypothetical protein
VVVRVDGHTVWNGAGGTGLGATLQDGYLTLHGVQPGTHTITVTRAGK